MQVKKQQLELDMEQQTGSKLGKEYSKEQCHTAHSIYMQSASCEMPGWKTHNQESRLPGEISTTSDDRYHYNGRKQRETKQPLDQRVKEESDKTGLNSTFKD